MHCQRHIAQILLKQRPQPFIIPILVHLIFIRVASKMWALKILIMQWIVAISYFKREKEKIEKIPTTKILCFESMNQPNIIKMIWRDFYLSYNFRNNGKSTHFYHRILYLDWDRFFTPFVLFNKKKSFFFSPSNFR